jgi:transcriptional regulator NrdR family protein
MGFFDKFRAALSVGSEKAIEEAGLSGFSNEVNLRVTENNLAKVKSDLVGFKVTVRSKESQLQSMDKEIEEFKAKLQERIDFCNREGVKAEDAERVKAEARKIFDRISEKEKVATELKEEIAELKLYEDKVEEEIARFDKSVSDGKNSIKTQLAKQEIANSKIRLADSAEKLIGSQTAVGSAVSEQTRKKEAEADIRFESIFGKSSDIKESEAVDDIIKADAKNEAFDSLFKK